MKKTNKFLTAFGAAAIAFMSGLNAHALRQAQEPIEIDPQIYDLEAVGQQSRNYIVQILNQYTLANNAYLNKILSPAKSLDMNKSDADRTAEANLQIAYSLGTIINAFDSAADDNKVAQVAAALKQLDPNFEKDESARIEFTNGKPSAAFSRIGIVIEKGSANAEKVMQAFSSHKRSAKPSDYFYEYENPFNISQGSISEKKGNDKSWIPPMAASPLKNGQSLVLKKCRQILGWRCSTTYLNQNKLSENMYYLFAGNYNLAENQDHSYFEDDSRTKNQVAGSTALFVVKESAKHILIAGVDSTWNTSGIMFGSVIQTEYQKDNDKFKKRLMLELGR
jgi:hypothetical protein